MHHRGDIKFTPVSPHPTRLPELNIKTDFSDMHMIVTGDAGVSATDATDIVHSSPRGWGIIGASEEKESVSSGESLTFQFVDTMDASHSIESVDDFRFMAVSFTGKVSSATIKVTVFTSEDMSTFITQTLNVTPRQIVEISNDITGFTAGTPIFAVKIENTGDSGAFRINGVELGEASEVLDLDLDFSLQLVDGNGDVVSQSFSVHLDGDSDSEGLVLEAIVGTSADDTLVGTAHGDLLIGGQGDDSLTGDTGADIFQWNLGDTGIDTITDFNQSRGNFFDAAEGDVLNFSDLFVGINALNFTNNQTLAEALDGSFLSITSDGVNSTIIADVDGGNPRTDIQTIIIEGVDLTFAGDLNSAQAIESLLTSGSMVVL